MSEMLQLVVIPISALTALNQVATS